MNSKRLNTLVSMIPDNVNGVFDIGSDHGYLLVSLRNKNRDLKLCGVENKNGPYENLCKNTKDKNILCKLSDGLNDYIPGYDLVVLAGMGFNNIKNIIDKNINKIDDIKYFLIDSHNLIPSIREYFIKLKYYIKEENIVFENGIFYELILFEKGHKEYSRIEINYGPILLKKKNDDFINKYVNINNKIYEIINNNQLDKDSLLKFEEEIKNNLEIIKK